ncbi:MAG: relaxase domain-containing protein, partial [Proteobacteria bacterium]|nr:relaxase domain-containing protein [Pseudomonadota bacterium]
RENILAGRLANGDERTAREWQRTITKSRTPIGYVDYTFSADKSVSLAWAFAPTEAERNLIAQAHRDAVHAAMLAVAETVGQARMGKGGRDGAEKGSIGWVAFDHYTARPTLEIARRGADGRMETELVTVKVAGDPQLHTHVAVPNVVLTPGGRVGSLDMLQMHDRIHEWGALYQAHLAQNLRALGAEVTLDETLGSARLTAVPDAVRAAFSKRTRDALADAKSYAKDSGANWDRMSPDERIMLLKGGAFASRSAKADDLSDFSAWERQAAKLGYRHRSVLDPLNPKPALSAEQRIDVAYRAGAKLLGRQFEHRAVLGEADARVAAARGLIASGLSGAADIDTVRAVFSKRGVTDTWSTVSGGLFAIRPQTSLIEVALVRDDPAVEGATITETRLTTQAQLDQEQRVIELARKHAADPRGGLTPAAIQRGIAATDLDLTGAHGQAQRRIIDHLGLGGRFAVAIGAAGAGKTTLLKPLVAAWHEQGADIHGVSLGWRQARELRESGLRIADPIRRRNPVQPEAWGEFTVLGSIPPHLRGGSPDNHRDSVAAVSVFINRVKSRRLALSHRSVVVIDELGTIGTRQLAELLKLQDQYQFRMVAIGDPKQCQSIEAGSVIRLLETALGKIPSIETTVRQTNPRAREIAGLLRAGKGAEALAMKYQDKTAEIVPGGVSEIVERAAALWHERQQANADRPRYSISISAPTNEDARAIGAAIRARLQASGELGRDATTLAARDPNSLADYDLPLAPGDRVRLFARTNASLTSGQSGVIGDNGSILEVKAIQRDGLILRNDKGTDGLVVWEALTDQRSGRVRLTYGYAMTTNTAQGATTTEHIFVTPAGSRMTDGFKSYVSGSRHRERDYWLTSEGAERQEIVGRRPLGDPRPIHEHDIWANWGRNIMRRPEILNATDIVAQADQVRRGTARSFMTGKERHETTAQTTDQREELQRKFQHTHVRAAEPAVQAIRSDFAEHQRQTQGTIERLTQAGDVVRRAVTDRISRARPLLDRARGVARERIDA